MRPFNLKGASDDEDDNIGFFARRTPNSFDSDDLNRDQKDKIDLKGLKLTLKFSDMS